MSILIILLVTIVILLSLYIYYIKITLRSITRQIRNGKFEKLVNISLVDKDVIEFAAAVNEEISSNNKQILNIIKKEKMLKESISNVSHDLRTPLTSVIGYLQLLKSSKLTEQQKGYVDIILTRSKDLKELISDFYELSLIERDEALPVLKNVNLVKALTEYILDFADLLEKKCIEPKFNSDKEKVYVLVDESMLKRVIYNLISNALKYSAGGLNVFITSNNAVTVVFENYIKDDSIEVDNIFEKFYTGNVARNCGNTGLGLYIAKTLMLKMGGDITAHISERKIRIKLLFKEIL